MRLDLDAKVRASDGEDIGHVDRAVIDPQSNEVTHIVVRTGAIFRRDIMVPREDLERGSRDGDTIRLTLTKDQAKLLPDFEPERYGPPPGTWIAPAAYGLPLGSYAYPLAVDPMMGGMPILIPDKHTEVDEHEPITLTKGALVLDRDGHDIGVVDDVRFDADSGRLQGFVLRVGGALRTLFGGGDTVEVSRRQIEFVGESMVRLRLAQEEVEAAPAGAAVSAS